MAKTQYLDYAGLQTLVNNIKAEDNKKTDKVASATAGNLAGLDSNGNLTDSGKKVKVASEKIVADTTDESLVCAKQVAEFVEDQVSGLTGAMHFTFSVTPSEGQSDVEAITAKYAAESKEEKAGDFVIITTNSKEYVYNGSTWVELGAEELYLLKADTVSDAEINALFGSASI